MRPFVICVGIICFALASLVGFLLVRTPVTAKTPPSPWGNKDGIHYYAPPPELKLSQDVEIHKESVTSSFSANPTEDLGLVWSECYELQKTPASSAVFMVSTNLKRVLCLGCTFSAWLTAEILNHPLTIRVMTFVGYSPLVDLDLQFDQSAFGLSIPARTGWSSDDGPVRKIGYRR